MNLDEALRQIGGYLYGVQHHERAQRVTHSLEALDEGSGTEGREQGRRRVAIRALFIGGGGSSALIFSSLQRFSVLRTSKRCFPTPATIIFPCRFHARHWLWIRLGLEAAAGQTITRTTDEANLFIHIYAKR